ncbi:MAG: hypothetical protein MJY82_06625 [Fibrobacter sp.]|nr:hypothetical protein [Fibrobacter sp.]
MDVALKITLVAAIVFMGYNIAEFAENYSKVCEKTDEFKKMAVENDAGEASLRRSNLLLSLILSLVFVGLTYLSGLAFWVTAVVAVKLVFSLYCSDSMLIRVLRVGEVSKKIYMLSKVDSLLNALLSLGIALILVL